MRGRRSYYLNRQACSRHVDLMNRAGFKVIHISRQQRAQSVVREDLCGSLSSMTDEDLCTSSAHIVLLKE